MVGRGFQTGLAHGVKMPAQAEKPSAFSIKCLSLYALSFMLSATHTHTPAHLPAIPSPPPHATRRAGFGNDIEHHECAAPEVVATFEGFDLRALVENAGEQLADLSIGVGPQRVGDFHLVEKSRLPRGHRFRAVDNERAFAMCSDALVKACATLRAMSTLAEIETAADSLSSEEKEELLRFLAMRLRRDGAMPKPRIYSEEELVTMFAEDEADGERFRQAC